MTRYFFPLLAMLVACAEPGYYVSVNGRDDNPGTKNKPFKTLAKVNSLEPRPGDAIFLKAGEIFDGMRASVTFIL